MKRLCLILPAFNESKMLGKVLLSLKKYLCSLADIETEIVVVDDGSRDGTHKIALEHNCVVLRHVLNRGLGGALATGLVYAKRHQFDVALTMDSDGQHDPNDILPALKPILRDECDVVIGTRMVGQDGMPFDRKVLNFLSNALTFILFQVWSSDSQSGFRVFGKKALELITVKTQGMEVSSEFFAEIRKNKLRYKEVPITVIYSDYSRKKGQSNFNSIPITLKLLLRLFR